MARKSDKKPEERIYPVRLFLEAEMSVVDILIDLGAAIIMTGTVKTMPSSLSPLASRIRSIIKL